MSDEIPQKIPGTICDPERLARLAEALIAWADDPDDTRTVHEVSSSV